MINKNFFNILKNKHGVAIVPIIIALGVVGAGTLLITNLNKSNKVESARARSISFVEMEKKRISGVLSDVQTCKLAGNFGGGAAVVTKTSLVTSTSQTLVTSTAPNNEYFNKVLTLSSIKTQAKNGTPGPKDYELILDYTDATANNGRSSFIGKKNSQIRIPMYMKIVSGVVTECYAMTENSDVDRIITQACSPTTANTNRKSALHSKGGVSAECQNQFTFSDNTDPLHRNSTCGTNEVMRGFKLSSVTLPTGIDLVTGNNLDVPPASTPDYCEGLPGASSSSDCAASTTVNGTTVQQVLYNLSSSTASCAYVGTTARDPSTCGAGQILYRSSSTVTSCVSVNCATLNEFVQSISSSATTCYKAPATTCTGTQYVKTFNASGADTCAELPVMSGTCAGGQFGYSITRATATANGVLNCTAYNKAKSCAATGTQYTTFAYAFTATGANCTQW